MSHPSSPAATRLALYAILTFCLVYAVHGYCRMYFDDYAYAGLTYFYNTTGTYEERFTFFNFFKYLYEHYMGWGGRVVPFSFIIPLLYAGPEYFWFAQAVVVTAILLLSTLLARKLAKDNAFLVYYLAIILAYFMIPIDVASDGLYWAAASSAYVWPAAFFLSALLLMQSPPLTAAKKTGIAVLLFLAAASAEMYSVSTLVTMGCIVFFKLCFTKRFDKSQFFFFLVSLAGFSFMAFAPGNFARALVQNAQRPDLLEMLQGFIDFLPHMLNALLRPSGTFHVIFVLCFCAIVYNTIMLFKNKDDHAIFAASLGVGFIALFSVFLIPEARSNRMSIPLFLLAPVIGAPMLAHVTRLAGAKLTLAALAIALVGPTQNYIATYKGYKANYPVIVASDKNLADYEPGDTTVDFYILPDDKYAAYMPYYKPLSFMEVFIKSRYDIPSFVQFIYNKKYLSDARKTEVTNGIIELQASGPQKNCELIGWVPKKWGLWAESTTPEIKLFTKAPLKTLELEMVALVNYFGMSQPVEVYIGDTLVSQGDITAIPAHIAINIPESAQKIMAETGTLHLKFLLPGVVATPPGTPPLSVGLRSLGGKL